jgi:GT2 family glycosyltransferase
MTMPVTRKAKHRPQISVIIVTMNRQADLGICLRSLDDQTFRDFEVLVVDNSSSDGTGDMVLNLFPEVRYFYLDTNSGPAGGRNYGVRLAAGEICVFIDDDAFFKDKDALERVVPYFSSDSKLGCIAFRIVTPSDGLEEYKSIPRVDKKSLDEDYPCSYFCGAGFACRRSLFIEMGMFWEPLIYCAEELDLGYRLIDRGYQIVRASTISVIHYETPQGRVTGKWIYFGVRSRCWVALRNLPYFNMISHVLLWCGYYFFSALRYCQFGQFLLGIKDALIGFPEAVKCRRCIAKETLKRLKKLHGRIYY